MMESNSRGARWWRWFIAFVCALAASLLAGLFLLQTAQEPGAGLSGIVPALIGMSVVGGLVFYLVARSAIAAVLVGVGLPATFAAILYIALWIAFSPHSEKYPKGPVTSIEPLTTFSDFPVYWLGRTYNGVDLTQIHTQTEPGTGPAHTGMYLTYGYGVCTSEGLEQRCSSTPILLVVEPTGASARVDCRSRGASDRYLRTADVLITAYGSAPPSKQDLLRDLSLANVSRFPDARDVDSIDYARFRSPCANVTPEPTPPSSPPVSP